MLTVNPRLNSLPGWELDSYGYGGNHAFPTDQIDTQNPFISPILPPSTKTFACTPPANLFSPSFDETTVGVDIASSAQPVQVSPNASAPSPATTSTPMTSAGSPSQSPPPPSPKPEPKRASKNHDRKRSPNHIKRPSNAFLIYRTHLVKSEEGEKIKKVEKNQQILSKFVGEKWRRLSEEDRAKWVAKAKEAQEQHALKHPNYSYQPAKREQIKRRRQRKTAEQKEEDKVNLLNRFSPETMKQPIVESTAPRKRKSRAKKKTVEPQQQEQQEQEPAVLSASSTSLKAPVQADSQPVISKPITANDILASAAPVVSETTAANELQARFSRDKAAGMSTTTDMYNAQYTYTSFFAPQQSQFLPSSQVQVEYHGSSIVPNDLFKGDVFQSLLLPPGAAGSSAQNWGAEGSAVSAGSGNDFVNISHMSGKPMDFPIQMYSQPENQHSDMRLAEPKFVSSADLSQINLNLDGFDFSFFYGSEGATTSGTQAITPADIIQFASNEGLSEVYGFTNTNGGENLDAGVQPVGSVMSQSQEAGTGTLVHGNSNVVGAHMNANHANLGITVGSEAEKKNHDDVTSGVSSQYFGTVNPSEISISQSGLGIYPYQQLDGNATVQAESGVIIKEPRFFDFSKGNLEVATSTAHVDPVTLTQENGYGSKGVVYTNQPTYYPAAVVVQPENQHPDMYTNFMVDDYGALNDNDTNNVLVSNTNVHSSATAGHPIIVQVEDHHHQTIVMNHLADPQIQSYSVPPSHSYLEMNDGYGMMHCSDPTLAGVFVPDKPPPYLYQRTLDVPTNAIANGNGYEHGHGHGHGHGYGY